MTPNHPLLALLVSIIAMLALSPVPGSAASAACCPAARVCDHALGIDLLPQPGWIHLAPPQVPGHVIAFATRPIRGQDYDIRLQIAPWGVAGQLDDAKAAQAGADRLIGGFHTRLHVSRTPIRYDGAPGELIRGLPPTPHRAVDIVPAHDGVIYLIIAPGSAPSLAPDQQAALASMRFIPRRRPFPSANLPAPTGPSSARAIPGGSLGHRVLTLTRANGIRGATHTYSLWFTANKGWVLTYSMPCGGTEARLVVRVIDRHGEVLDRVLHRSGSVRRVHQTECIGGELRLDVRSRCSGWTVTASPVQV